MGDDSKDGDKLAKLHTNQGVLRIPAGELKRIKGSWWIRRRMTGSSRKTLPQDLPRFRPLPTTAFEISARLRFQQLLGKPAGGFPQLPQVRLRRTLGENSYTIWEGVNYGRSSHPLGRFSDEVCRRRAATFAVNRPTTACSPSSSPSGLTSITREDSGIASKRLVCTGWDEIARATFVDGGVC